MRNWSGCDLSHATWVRDFARHKLENTTPDGVLISALDPDTFPIWYVQEMLGVRQDVLNLDLAMLRGTWHNLDWDHKRRVLIVGHRTAGRLPLSALSEGVRIMVSLSR